MENQNPPNQEQPQTIIIQVPSADNIASRRPLIPASFAFAIICFFFTFCDFKCVSNGQKLASVTGIELVTGTQLKDHDMMSGRETEGEEIPSSIWAILALSAAVIGLGVFLIKGKNEAPIGVSAGAIGVASLFILQFLLKSTMEEKGHGKVEADFQFAYWGALLAMGVAGLISYLRMEQTSKNKKIAIGMIFSVAVIVGGYEYAKKWTVTHNRDVRIEMDLKSQMIKIESSKARIRDIENSNPSPQKEEQVRGAYQRLKQEEEKLMEIQKNAENPVNENKSVVDKGEKFLGKWTEDDYETFTITKIGEKFHIESDILWDGVKTEWNARLINGELVGRPADDATGRNTVIKIVGANLKVTNLFDNNKTLHKSK